MEVKDIIALYNAYRSADNVQPGNYDHQGYCKSLGLNSTQLCFDKNFEFKTMVAMVKIHEPSFAMHDIYQLNRPELVAEVLSISQTTAIPISVFYTVNAMWIGIPK